MNLKQALVLFWLTISIAGCGYDCEDSELCKKHGQCINYDKYRCITGCEEKCKEDGLCTPVRLDDELTCVATENDCHESNVCINSGRCSSHNGYCIPGSDDECQQSLECGMKGNCKVVNRECRPKTNGDCQKSFDCIFHNKCFVKYKRGVCVTLENL